MEKLQQFFVLINNMAFRSNPKYIRVSLKDREGKVIKKIEEKALFKDKNFRDLSGLYMGLKEAENFGAKRILILTNNSFLSAVIKNGHGEEDIDYYGFYNDINRMINNFEEVRIKVVM